MAILLRYHGQIMAIALRAARGGGVAEPAHPPRLCLNLSHVPRRLSMYGVRCAFSLGRLAAEAPGAQQSISETRPGSHLERSTSVSPPLVTVVIML